MSEKSKATEKHPSEDDVLRRMLNTPPKPHKPLKENASNGMTGVEAFSQLADHMRSSVELPADVLVRLDKGLCVGVLEVDRTATARAGHVVMKDKPTKDLLDILATIRALDT